MDDFEYYDSSVAKFVFRDLLERLIEATKEQSRLAQIIRQMETDQRSSELFAQGKETAKQLKKEIK